MIAVLYNFTNGRFALFGLFLCLFSACGGREESRTELSEHRAESAPQASSVPVADEEIVPVLAPLSTPLAEDRVLPEDPAAFRAETVAALKSESPETVLPMLDVLLVLNPDDHEMRERRAMLLLREGRSEDGAVDLKICCTGGRASCCR